MNCSVCNKRAHGYCGHGCKTAYCGESCAKSVYNVHKEECRMLIETADATQMLQRINYGSPQQTYNNVYNYHNIIMQEINQYERMNFFQKRFAKTNIDNSVQAFVYATNYILSNRQDVRADMQHYRAIMDLRNAVLMKYQSI